VPTYYVRPTNGSDAANGLSFANAWQTSQYAFDNAASGDEIRLCNEATETPSATIDIDTAIGSVSSPVLVIGADSTDGSPLTTGQYIISGSALPATTDLVIVGATTYMDFTRVRFTAATRDGFVVSSLSSGYHDFILCRFDTCTGDGLYWPNTTGYGRLIACEFDSNGGDGFSVNTNSRGNVKSVGSSYHDNSGYGCYVGGDAGVLSLIFNEAYDNGDDGFRLVGGSSSAGGTGLCANNVSYGNTGSGFWIDGAFWTSHNNSAVSNSQYGFEFHTVSTINRLVADYNHTHNNTAGVSSHTMTGDNNVTGDPEFASVTDGSEDFTPANGSPLDSAGINGVDIGARKAADPAGGGSNRVRRILVPI